MTASVEFWLGRLNLSARTRLAPYGQLFPQLLDPASLLRSNAAGANIVCVRWEDLAGANTARVVDAATVQRIIEELASALLGFEHTTPCLVLVGPSDSAQPEFSRATEALASRLAGAANLFVETGERAMRRYDVARPHDADANRFGHVPFTEEGLAALGTTIARWYAALVRRPIKVIATDADNTLWSGVLGEDGADGIRVDGGYASLQRKLAEQTSGGRLVCVLSKNEEQDVLDLFSRRTEMPLRREHVVAHRIDWNPKPDNLRSLASELELGVDSFVFIDDNPVECAEMRARHPNVITVRVPAAGRQVESFVEHLWPLDQFRVTAEDQKRSQMYRDNASRAQLKRSVQSLDAFLKSLDLVVDIEAPTAVEVPRLAQLTQRTNQFNASLLRCEEPEIRRGLASGDTWTRFVRARDRFGDYGIVGQVRARMHGQRLEADLFMLSCRALGRGVEHLMLASLGRHALERGLAEVAVSFRRGDRNGPARRFLERIFSQPAPEGETGWFTMPSAKLAGLQFDASAGDAGEVVEDDSPPAAASANGAAVNESELYEEIAHSLTTGADIVRAMAKRVRPRPDLPTGFVAPAAGRERDIAVIWQEVLRVDPVGANDRFQDLGGKSIHLVQVHRLLLERLRIDVDITTLFQYATVSLLAAHLSSAMASGGTDAASLRAQQMRAARDRASARHGARR